MKRDKQIEYYVEYVEDDEPWVVGEYKTEQEAFNKLEQCKIAAPLRNWQVCKATITYSRIIMTSEQRVVEVAY